MSFDPWVSDPGIALESNPGSFDEFEKWGGGAT